MDEEDLSLAKVLSRGSNASLTVEDVEITGKRLLRSLDFWLLTGILCCLSGMSFPTLPIQLSSVCYHGG
jgi:hypothetical protein